MQKRMLQVVVMVALLGLMVSSGWAFTCPALVEQCRQAVNSMSMKPGADQTKAAQMKQGCEDALQLHQTGQHAEAVAKAKETIQMAGGSVNQ